MNTLQSCQYFINTAVSSSMQLLTFSTAVVLLGLILKTIFSIYRTQQLKRQLLIEKVPLPTEIERWCKQKQVPQQSISVIKSEQYIAASVGFVQPQILISTSLLSSLSTQEIEAVLLHEWYHAKQRHPLLVMSLKSLQKIFPVFPIISDVANHLACRFECQADQYVMDQQQTNHHLKTAMRTFIQAEQPVFSNLPDMANFAFSHWQKRLASLDNRPVSFDFSNAKLLISVASAGLLIAVSAANHNLAQPTLAQQDSSHQINQTIADHNCNLMSCASECITTQNATRQQSRVGANLNEPNHSPTMITSSLTE